MNLPALLPYSYCCGRCMQQGEYIADNLQRTSPHGLTCIVALLPCAVFSFSFLQYHVLSGFLLRWISQQLWKEIPPCLLRIGSFVVLGLGFCQGSGVKGLGIKGIRAPSRGLISRPLITVALPTPTPADSAVFTSPMPLQTNPCRILPPQDISLLAASLPSPWTSITTTPIAAAGASTSTLPPSLPSSSGAPLVLPLPDALAFLLLFLTLPLAPLAPAAGDSSAGLRQLRLQAADLSLVSPLLKGCEDDLREASVAAVELLARVAVGTSGGGISSFLEPAAKQLMSSYRSTITSRSSSGRGGGGDLSGNEGGGVQWEHAESLLAALEAARGQGVVAGAEVAEEGVVNFCLVALTAPAVLGFKPSDGEECNWWSAPCG